MLRGELLAIAALGLVLGFAGCDSSDDAPATPDPTSPTNPTDPTDPNPPDKPDPVVPDDDCASTARYFNEQVWLPLLSVDCIGCHNPQGAAATTKFVLQSPHITGYMETNYETVRNVAAFEYEGTSILMLKPSMGMPHAGGMLIEPGSPSYMALERLVTEFKDPIICDETAKDDFFHGIHMLSARETFRKAALALGGRMPTLAETTEFTLNGDVALDSLLDGLLQEDTFYAWLKEMYNDKFLVNKYMNGDDALELVNMEDYPDMYWFEAPMAYNASPFFAQQGALYTNRAVAQEALELIAYIVRNNLPFTDIVAADYTVVNPYSAIAYGVQDQVTFEDPTDATEFHKVKLPGVPHAGVMTAPLFLNRFPTTATNRNRHRSRIIWDFFLATDVMKLAARPIDPTSIEDHNPTMFNADCSVCHATIDPIAGCFQNWTASGRYLPPEEGWHSDMLPPGFGEDIIPYEGRFEAVSWLGKRIASDTRFVTAVVRTAYEGLLGQKVLAPPGTGEDDGDAMVDQETLLAQSKAYDAQQAVLTAIGEKFVESGYDYRVVIKGLIMSPYFRVVDASEEVITNRANEITDLGSARLATPEMLHRRIIAATGYPWRASAFGTNFLLSNNEFRIFFGGIDSDNVTKRITVPNGLMTSVADRMATEVSCRSVARDFSIVRHERHLFPFAEPTYSPADANGFPVPQAEEAIKENIRYLHWRILGEDVQRTSPEVDNTFQLFYAVWKDGRAAVAAGEEPTALPQACQSTHEYWTAEQLPADRQVIQDPNYVVRSWMAVVTYLLSDYRFLYE